MLAFDKRLTYLGKGNDVTSSDVQKVYDNYDGENNYLMLDLSIDNTWHICSKNEKELIEKGRKASKQHTSSSESAVLVDDSYSETDSVDTSNGKNGPNTNIDKVREEFPETWIFESFFQPLFTPTEEPQFCQTASPGGKRPSLRFPRVHQ